MDRAADILRTTERLYAAASEPWTPNVWAPALEAVTDLLHGDHAILVGSENGSADGPFVASARVDGRDLARFFSAEGMRIMTPMFGAVPTGIVPRAAFISDPDFARSAAYNELIRPMNGFHGIHAKHEGAARFVLNVCRPQGTDNFDATD